MNENIKAFLEKLSKDEALQEKLKNTTDPDVAYQLVSSVQGGFTKEEFVETMQKIKEALANSGEMSDDDLSKAAGGLEIGDTGIDVETVAGFAAGVFGTCICAIYAS